MNPFLHFGDDQLARHFGDYQVVRHADGDVVCDGFSARHFVYIVRSGMVRVSLLSMKGSERLLFYGRSGSLMGDTMCFSPQKDVPEGLRVVSMGPCEVIRVSHEKFRAACARDPELAMGVIARSYSKVSRLIEQLEYATFRDTTCQLAALLQALAQEAYPEGARSAPRLLHMTHQSMAAATGRTRVSVTYALNRLQESGAIRLSRGHIEVVDDGLLDEFAQEAHENVLVSPAPRRERAPAAPPRARQAPARHV